MRKIKFTKVKTLILFCACLYFTPIFSYASESLNLNNADDYLSRTVDTDLSFKDTKNKDEITAEIERIDEQIKQLTSELNEMDSYIDFSTYAMIQSILEIQGLVDGTTGVLITQGDQVFNGMTNSAGTVNTRSAVGTSGDSSSNTATLNSLLSEVRANNAYLAQLENKINQSNSGYDNRIKLLEDIVQINRLNLINFTKGSALQSYTDGTAPVAKGTNGYAVTGGYDFNNFTDANALASNSKLSDAVKSYLNIPIINSVTINNAASSTSSDVTHVQLDGQVYDGVTGNTTGGDIYLGVYTNVTIPSGYLTDPITVWAGTKAVSRATATAYDKKNILTGAGTQSGSSDTIDMISGKTLTDVDNVNIDINNNNMINLGVNEKITIAKGYYNTDILIRNGDINRGTIQSVLDNTDTNTILEGYYTNSNLASSVKYQNMATYLGALLGTGWNASNAPSLATINSKLSNMSGGGSLGQRTTYTGSYIAPTSNTNLGLGITSTSGAKAGTLSTVANNSLNLGINEKIRLQAGYYDKDIEINNGVVMSRKYDLSGGGTAGASGRPETNTSRLYWNMGVYNTNRYVSIAKSTVSATSLSAGSSATISAGYVPSAITITANANTGTYPATIRGSSVDMGASNSYRYVNTSNVPNKNTGTYTFPSGSKGTQFDMSETNNIRYVDATNVYTRGYGDGYTDGLVAGQSSTVNVQYEIRHVHGDYCYPVPSTINESYSGIYYVKHCDYDGERDTWYDNYRMDCTLECSACHQTFTGISSHRHEHHVNSGEARGNAMAAFNSHLTLGRCHNAGYACNKSEGTQIVNNVSSLGTGDTVIRAIVNY